MPEYLHEDYVTVANDLVFPSVQSCCALVVTTTQNNRLGGLHFTVGTTKAEMDRALLHIRTELGGAADGVYLIGNVDGRRGVTEEGMAYPGPLRDTIRSGLTYGFGIKFHDIGINNPGVAVNARRDGPTNVLRLSVAAHGGWALGPMVVPAPGMYRVKQTIAAAMDGNAGTKLRMTAPPPTGVDSCAMAGAAALSPFLLPTF